MSASFSRRSFGKVLAWYRTKSPVMMFVLVLAGLMAAYYAASLTPLFQNTVFPAFMRYNASVSSFLLNWLGQATRAVGSSIFSKGFAVDVRRGCDAIEPTVLFVSAVLAFPGPPRRKLIGAFVGALVLLVTNLVRIVSLFLVGVYYPGAFHAMHTEIWQVAFILLAVVLWAAWIQWAMPPAKPAPHAQD